MRDGASAGVGPSGKAESGNETKWDRPTHFAVAQARMEREAAAIEAELHKLHRLELRAKRDETGRCSQVVPRVGFVSV